MNRVVYSFLILAVFASCAEQYGETYSIKGASSVSRLDGNKLYLSVVEGEELKNIDSCEVVHGAFSFSGKYDTVRVAMLSINDGTPPVLVIEKGDILVNIDRTGHKVSGTPLNDQLYEYLDRLIQLSNQRGELGHREIQMMLEGVDEKTIAEKLSVEDNALLMQLDSLETNFILDNLDNVLGPYAFQLLTSNYNYPVLTPQIEEILGKASDKFKGDAYVSWYHSKAKEIMARLRGEIDDNGVSLEPAAPKDSLTTLE